MVVRFSLIFPYPGRGWNQLECMQATQASQQAYVIQQAVPERQVSSRQRTGAAASASSSAPQGGQDRRVGRVHPAFDFGRLRAASAAAISAASASGQKPERPDQPDRPECRCLTGELVRRRRRPRNDGAGIFCACIFEGDRLPVQRGRDTEQQPVDVVVSRRGRDPANERRRRYRHDGLVVWFDLIAVLKKKLSWLLVSPAQLQSLCWCPHSLHGRPDDFNNRCARNNRDGSTRRQRSDEERTGGRDHC